MHALLTYEYLNPNRYTYRVVGNAVPLEARMAAFLRAQAPLEEPQLVWRGQSRFPLNAESWFSTSTKERVARSYGGQHLFKIHLMPGVHCVDMYQYYAQQGFPDPRANWNRLRNTYNLPNNLQATNDYTQFGEVIVGGGGTFWQDPKKMEEGFRFVGTVPIVHTSASPNSNTWSDAPDKRMRVYETFYFMD